MLTKECKLIILFPSCIKINATVGAILLNSHPVGNATLSPMWHNLLFLKEFLQQLFERLKSKQHFRLYQIYK